MILGIDAFNIISGGGLTHLKEFIANAKPTEHGFEKVYIWGSKDLLNKLDDKIWLVKIIEPSLNRNLFFRFLWHHFKSKKQILDKKCDILFAPGGTCLSGFRPNVTMCRNMLPFEWQELSRFGISLKTIKLILLRIFQLISFKRSDGLIFLSMYAKNTLKKFINKDNSCITIIPHGVNSSLFGKKKRKIKTNFSNLNPIRIIYVSNISPYKHQWNVVKAVYEIRKSGYPILLELIGEEAEGMPLLKETIKKYDKNGEFVFFKGKVEHDYLHILLSKGDIGVFASSCENLPNILLEIMSSSLPIVCSNMGPMPEILGNAGEYFNPLSPKDIELKLKRLILSPSLQKDLSKKAKIRSSLYKWENCTKQTLIFLSKIAQKNTNL